MKSFTHKKRVAFSLKWFSGRITESSWLVRGMNGLYTSADNVITLSQQRSESELFHRSTGGSKYFSELPNPSIKWIWIKP